MQKTGMYKSYTWPKTLIKNYMRYLPVIEYAAMVAPFLGVALTVVSVASNLK
jgi:hypothetical protein